MATIGELIDRTFRDYLTPPDEQPAQAPLETTINNSTTTVTLKDGYLEQAELDAIGVGTLFEIGSELFRTVNFDEGTLTLTTATRGTVLGTSAAAHTADDPVILRPKPPRITVFDAMADTIVDLWPSLGQIKTAQYDTSDGYISVASDVKQVIDYRYASTNVTSAVTRYLKARVELLEYPFTPATNDIAIQILDSVPLGYTGYLRYLADFTRPTAESDDFTSDCGCEDRWQLLTIFGALARITGIIDLPARTQEFITESMESQGYPVGSGENLNRALIRVHEYLLEKARRAFWQKVPGVIETNTWG